MHDANELIKTTHQTVWFLLISSVEWTTSMYEMRAIILKIKTT